MYFCSVLPCWGALTPLVASIYMHNVVLKMELTHANNNNKIHLRVYSSM